MKSKKKTDKRIWARSYPVCSLFPISIHHHSAFVFGPDIYNKLIPTGHILFRINKQIDFPSVNEACMDLYSKNQGLPVKNLPETMFRSANVQYLMDYSDREMEQAARYHLVIKWFLGISVENSSYDHSALGDFREKALRREWKKRFFMILKLIEYAGFAKGNQYVDATHIISNIAIPGTIGLIRHGIKRMRLRPI